MQHALLSGGVGLPERPLIGDRIQVVHADSGRFPHPITRERLVVGELGEPQGLSTSGGSAALNW